MPCTAGFYCPVDGMSSGSDPDYACPVGSYCLAGVQAPTACPLGTFNDAPGASVASNCTKCPPGYFCGPGTADYSLTVCPPGYACPEGTPSQDNTDTKPWDAAMCPAGTYQPYTMAQNASACLPCPAGFYCAQNSLAPSVCPAGYYCPQGTQSVCVAGTGTVCDSNPPVSYTHLTLPTKRIV